MPRLNVILRKEDLEPAFLHNKAVVVIDVLFATTTIVTALHQGAASVLATSNTQKACDAIRGLPADSYLLAGENHLRSIPGFAGYAPLDVARQPLQGRRLVYSTTNGTVALDRVNCALHVYAAALVNGPAMVEQLLQHGDLSIVFVCAGSAGRVNLEDLFTAGYFVRHLEAARPGHWQHTDTCSIARAVYDQYADEPLACLLGSQLGQTLQDDSLHVEVQHAAQIGLYPTIAKLDGQSLTALAAAPLTATGQ